MLLAMYQEDTAAEPILVFHGSKTGPSAISRLTNIFEDDSRSDLYTSSSQRENAMSVSKLAKTTLSEPVHDLEYIIQMYRTRLLKKVWEDNPKSPLASFMNLHLRQHPAYESVQGIAPNGRAIWRTVIRILGDGIDITALGHDINRRESEKLAALCAMYQLDGLGVLDQPQSKLKPKKANRSDRFSPGLTSSDSSTVDFALSSKFVEYYCDRVYSDKPAVSYFCRSATRIGTAVSWRAEMTVGGQRIGFGTGDTKSAALADCYVDVTQCVVRCDPGLWTTLTPTPTPTPTPSSLVQQPDELLRKIDSLQCADPEASKLSCKNLRSG